MYSYEKRKAAVELYLKYHSYAEVIRELGYPSRHYLEDWIEKKAGYHKACRKSTSLVKLSEEEKMQAVTDLCAKGKPADDVAKQYGVTRASLYN